MFMWCFLIDSTDVMSNIGIAAIFTVAGVVKVCSKFG